MHMKRRNFIRNTSAAAAGMGLASFLPAFLYWNSSKELFFQIAISQFSFASEFWTKQLDPLDFAAKSKELGIRGLDYCSMFFADKAKDQTYLNELKKRAADAGSYNLRIMIGGESVLGDLNETVRFKAVDNNYKWMDAAAALKKHRQAYIRLTSMCIYAYYPLMVRELPRCWPMFMAGRVLLTHRPGRRMERRLRLSAIQI
jgi:hypothetical protein